MIKKYKNSWILVTLLFILFFVLFYSSQVLVSVIDYSILFLTKLFPSTFVFFLLSSLLVEMGIIDFLKMIFPYSAQRFYAFFVSMISGFPSGAKTAVELFQKKLISLDSANNILLYTHFPNPLFLLGSVSTLFEDSSYSIRILLAIFFSNLSLFICFHKKETFCDTPQNISSSFSFSLNQVIQRTFSLIFLIYGTSLFFYLCSFLLMRIFSFSSIFYVFCNGIFDLTKGVFSTSVLPSPLFRAYFILFFISFGSLSIHMQVASILGDSPLSYSYFLLGRVIGSFFAFVFFTVFLLLS